MGNYHWPMDTSEEYHKVESGVQRSYALSKGTDSHSYLSLWMNVSQAASLDSPQ